MNKLFKENFKATTNYFETIFKEKKKLPQSIVFEGLDIFGQYFFALELARMANCAKDLEAECGCANCNWIRENKHPAVVTVSPIDFKEQGDESKTVISVKQAKNITKSLVDSSDFHRFFIFLDAKIGEMENHLKEQYDKWSELHFELPQENWVPSFINKKTFHENTLNSLLKSIEEPPNRTTFIFLTKNKDDLISTITSRSMTFKLPSKKFSFDYSDIKRYLDKYPNLDYEDAFEISDNMQVFMKEKDLTSNEILNMIEQFLGDLYKINPTSKKIKQDIEKVSIAKRRIKASMSAKNVFESMFLDFVR